MSSSYKEYGGGAATGLADNLVSFLSQGLNTGTFGAGSPAGSDAMGQSQGIAGVLNDILSGGAGKLGGSLSQLIQNDTNNQVNDMRARYGAAGGTAYGTGAQYGEGVLRAKQAPALTSAVGNLQLGAVQNLLGVISGIASKGIAQRQGAMEQNPWVTGLSMGANIVKQGLSAYAGAQGLPNMSAGGGGAGMDLGPMPGYQLTPSGGMPSMMPSIMPGVNMPTFSPPPSMSQYGWTPTLFDYGLTKRNG